MKGGKVVVDADRVIELLDEIRKEVNEKIDNLGCFLAASLTTETPAPAHQRKMAKASKGQPFELEGFDIDRIEWKAKGCDPAGPNAIWCWGFSTDRDGVILDEARPLVKAIERYGPEVVVGDYILTLSGRDGNLLSRRRIKK